MTHDTERRSRRRGMVGIAVAVAGALLGCGTDTATKKPQGLVYEEITPGTGASPGPTDRVKLHYRTTRPDGTEVDSTYKRGKSETFPLDNVIKCWTEGIPRMKVGGKSRLTCPPELAHGDGNASEMAKPGGTLVYEIELLDIVK